MPPDRVRWVLAFDGACGSCQGIADAVRAAADDRLEVLPLQHEDVQRWRRAALGQESPWRPVLLRVAADDSVQAVTGLRLSRDVVRRLGLRRSVDVLRALGRLRSMNRRGLVRRPGDSGPLVRTPGRRDLAATVLGAASVVPFLITGKAPGWADSVAAWARRNAGSLPTTWDGLRSLPSVYRRTAYEQLTPAQQSAAWTAHVDDFAARHPELDDAGRRVVARAREVAADVATFENPDFDTLGALTADALAVLGREQATTLLAELGPPDAPPVVSPNVSCTCATGSDWCSGSMTCRLGRNNCTRVGGCGTFYAYTCDGMCA